MAFVTFGRARGLLGMRLFRLRARRDDQPPDTLNSVLQLGSFPRKTGSVGLPTICRMRTALCVEHTFDISVYLLLSAISSEFSAENRRSPADLRPGFPKRSRRLIMAINVHRRGGVGSVLHRQSTSGERQFGAVPVVWLCGRPAFC
ncbi:hypothetical protein SKC41_30630 [Mycobacterium sp. 050128]|uniref:hypothetical protein n=1 Tax=Mycobacterium sp. 050128 TaxID=3096112 RepID=UPI002EDB1A25